MMTATGTMVAAQRGQTKGFTSNTRAKHAAHERRLEVTASLISPAFLRSRARAVPWLASATTNSRKGEFGPKAP